MSEIVLEFLLRFAKLILAGLIGVVIYVLLVGPFGVPGSPQLALESWIAGALVIPAFVTLSRNSDAAPTLSLAAGATLGAFGVLLAFGAGGKPGVVMSIIFAGAPIVNAVVALILHPPSGGWAKVPAPFYLGILLAALGGFLVTYFKPAVAPAKPKSATTAAVSSPQSVK